MPRGATTAKSTTQIQTKIQALKKELADYQKEIANLKSKIKCDHMWECGCDKPSCLEVDGVDCQEDDGLCDVDACRHYYDFRNDNCNCRGRECPYCSTR